MMWWDDAGWGGGQWLVMTLTMLVFWGALIGFGVWAVRNLMTDNNKPGGQPTAPASRADEVLAERYARGEIDESEYSRRRAVLHPTER